MDLKTWIQGIDLYMENIIQLRDDGVILLEHGSIGHAYFSFFTALEETAMISYIIESLYEPKPELFKKLFKHGMKTPYAMFRALKREFSFEDLSEKEKKKIFNARGKTIGLGLNLDTFKNSLEFIIGEMIIKQNDLWNLRNNSIYLNISDDNKRWITPKDIKREKAELLLKRLNEKIENLKGTIEYIHKDNLGFYS
ncbi:MAG: AbiV family abortive infection protein [Promethearchaeota archaeon]